MSTIEANISKALPQNKSEAIPEKDKVPLVQKSAFGLGIVSEHCADFGINQFAMPIFNTLLGLSPTLVGLVLGIAKLWDAFVDIFVGSLSDNSKNNYGRRKPLMYFGAILMGIFFPLIWFVPETWGEPAILSYLCITLIVFYTCFSLYSVSYQSIGMELTPNYQERTNVYSVMAQIQQISGVFIPWVLAIATFPVWGSVLTGIRWIGSSIGVIIILTGILPALLCVERYQKVSSKQLPESPSQAIKSLSSNKPFILLIVSIGIFLTTVTISHVLNYYVHTYYIYTGNMKDGALLSAYDGTLRAAFAIIGAILIQYLSKNIDKHKLIIACLILLIISRLGIYFTYIPNTPALTYLTKPFASVAEIGFWILTLSMRADIADWDEYKHGKRREGMIAASNNWVAKIATMLAVILGGLILQYVIGFNKDLGGNQSTATLNKLIHAYVLIPTIGYTAVLFIISRYNLSRKKLSQIRSELEIRREAV